MMHTQTQQYLERIEVTQSIRPTVECLKHLQLQHLLTVPFENLDIHWGQPIILEEKPVFEKIVDRKRGGFCYELNGMFCHLLLALGYRCNLVSARVFESGRRYSPAYDHAAILVHLDGMHYLVDVGFGAFCTQPIVLQQKVITQDETVNYRIEPYYTYWRVLSDEGEGWKPEYIFQKNPKDWADFAARSHFHQTDLRSHFAKGPMITQLTLNGRKTLTDKKWKNGTSEEPITDGGEFRQLLQQHFGIVPN